MSVQQRSKPQQNGGLKGQRFGMLSPGSNSLLHWEIGFKIFLSY